MNRKERVKIILLNAIVIAGITFFSTLSLQYPPEAQNIWAAFIGATLALLTQIRTLTDEELTELDELKPKRPLGILI